ncbi:uncharacterized protein G2W53_015389 [Senna tora]|uniref:Uncharacterized protein n=1 Tax=Senna tora TaxID=362788 RepID=A0A835C802_9FABA|nr:uncharacterized protein G2W53_015389 [Senna tora]
MGEAQGDPEVIMPMEIATNSVILEQDASVTREAPTEGVRHQVKRALWGPDQKTNLSYKERLLGFNGSRFGVIAQLEEETSEDQTQSGRDSSAMDTDNGDQVSSQDIKMQEQVPVRSKDIKVKPKKHEQHNLSFRKLGPNAQIIQEARRNSKPPSDKASEHTVVTSTGVSRKQQNQVPLSKSPCKTFETPIKVASKPSVETTINKHKKPPDFEESLHLIKLAEKEARASGILLSDLGVTQGVASKSFPGLVKDLFSNFKLDILALYETRVSGDKANEILKKCNVHNFIRIEADGNRGCTAFGIPLCMLTLRLKFMNSVGFV